MREFTAVLRLVRQNETLVCSRILCVFLSCLFVCFTHQTMNQENKVTSSECQFYLTNSPGFPALFYYKISRKNVYTVMKHNINFQEKKKTIDAPFHTTTTTYVMSVTVVKAVIYQVNYSRNMTHHNLGGSPPRLNHFQKTFP